MIIQLLQTCKRKYEELYANAFENLSKMEKFLEKCSLLTMTQEDRENLNSPINSKE